MIKENKKKYKKQTFIYTQYLKTLQYIKLRMFIVYGVSQSARPWCPKDAFSRCWTFLVFP